MRYADSLVQQGVFLRSPHNLHDLTYKQLMPSVYEISLNVPVCKGDLDLLSLGLCFNQKSQLVAWPLMR